MGCVKTNSAEDVTCRPGSIYEGSEYSVFKERACRSDFPDLCVEANVTLPKNVIDQLISESAPKFKQDMPVVAIRVEDWHSQIEKTPHIEVVTGSYGWVKNGERVEWEPNKCLESFDGYEEIVEFYQTTSGWKYKDTYEKIYDPF